MTTKNRFRIRYRNSNARKKLPDPSVNIFDES
jgi:hypothetical protein